MYKMALIKKSKLSLTNTEDKTKTETEIKNGKKFRM
jgi:hypothetical protein